MGRIIHCSADWPLLSLLDLSRSDQYFSKYLSHISLMVHSARGWVGGIIHCLTSGFSLAAGRRGTRGRRTNERLICIRTIYQWEFNSASSSSQSSAQLQITHYYLLPVRFTNDNYTMMLHHQPHLNDPFYKVHCNGPSVNAKWGLIGWGDTVQHKAALHSARIFLTSVSSVDWTVHCCEDLNCGQLDIPLWASASCMMLCCDGLVL